MLLGKNFDDIDLATVQGLVDAGATESVHLEYKRDAYGASDQQKREFLKDIASFANCLGGHLIIGIAEKGGTAASLSPLSDIDVDQELLRLENIVRTGIEPAIIGLRMKRVQADGGSIIVIHVPRSFNPPHRVNFKNSNRYYSRNSSGVYELSVAELRMLFGQQRSVEERARAFARTRFLRVQANDGSQPLPVENGGIVVHLVPLPDFGADRRLSISELRTQQEKFRPLASLGFSGRVNLEGFCTYNLPGAYTQIFRHGSVEATSTTVFQLIDGKREFPPVALAKAMLDTLDTYMAGLKALEASPPIMLHVSFFGMKGVHMAADFNRRIFPQEPYSQEELHLPPTIISHYHDDGKYPKSVAEQMHFLWNVFGFERCAYFDQDDNWAVPN